MVLLLDRLVELDVCRGELLGDRCDLGVQILLRSRQFLQLAQSEKEKKRPERRSEFVDCEQKKKKRTQLNGVTDLQLRLWFLLILLFQLTMRSDQTKRVSGSSTLNANSRQHIVNAVHV